MAGDNNNLEFGNDNQITDARAASILQTLGAGANGIAAFAAIMSKTTGWASYVDTTHTSGSPYAITADTDTHLQIEPDTVIDGQKPDDVTAFYVGSPDYEITGRNGDNLDLMLYFKAVPSNATQWLDVWIDIGGAIGEIYRQTFSFPKGVGVERGVLYAIPSGYTAATWAANGGKVYVRSNHDMDIYDINLNIDRSHRARQ